MILAFFRDAKADRTTVERPRCGRTYIRKEAAESQGETEKASSTAGSRGTKRRLFQRAGLSRYGEQSFSAMKTKRHLGSKVNPESATFTPNTSKPVQGN